MVAKPAAFSEIHAMHKAQQQLEELLQQQVAELQDKALTIGLEEFKPGLVKQAGLQSLKKQLRFADVLDGDHMVYWQPTDELIMFLQAPKIDFANAEAPKVSVGYRTPTPVEREQLAPMGRNVSF